MVYITGISDKPTTTSDNNRLSTNDDPLTGRTEVVKRWIFFLLRNNFESFEDRIDVAVIEGRVNRDNQQLILIPCNHKRLIDKILTYSSLFDTSIETFGVSRNLNEHTYFVTNRLN